MGFKILATAKNQHFVESIMRVVSTQMGSFAALCLPPLPIHDARDFGVTRSLSQAWRIGRAIAICRQSKYVLCFSILLQSDYSYTPFLMSDVVISMVLRRLYWKFKKENAYLLERSLMFLG
jgi:DUF917 family protein